MFTIKRTTSDDQDFRDLVHFLDKDLAIKNGDTNSFFAQFNKLDTIKHALVYYAENTAVGCGAFKAFDESSVEIKRMFVNPTTRGKGVGSAILKELEAWAAELKYTGAVLETDKTNMEAIGLYQKSGYSVIPNYGQYVNVESSVCMKKPI